MAPHLPALGLGSPRTRPRRCGGGGRIRTYEGVSRQIYSLLPLTAWVPLRENEPRILISGRRGVNASWRAICLPPPDRPGSPPEGTGFGPFHSRSSLRSLLI